MAYRNSTSAGGTAYPATVAVPAGAATDDIAILAISIDVASLPTFTWPSGFTQFDAATLSGPDGHAYGSAWKRLTGADSGNYSITPSAGSGNDHLVDCALFSGRHTTNPPVASTLATNTTANSSPISVSANGVTAVTGDDLLWIGAADATSAPGGTSWSPPSTFTERQDDVNIVGSGWCNGSIASKDNVSSGATGTITGTFIATATAGWFASLVRIPAASGAASIPNKIYQSNFAIKRASYY